MPGQKKTFFYDVYFNIYYQINFNFMNSGIFSVLVYFLVELLFRRQVSFVEEGTTVYGILYTAVV